MSSLTPNLPSPVPQLFLASCGDPQLAKLQAPTTVSTPFSIGQPVFTIFIAPLGNRRRFGPAPVEESAPPQLAQPSPSAYPRPQLQNDRESSRLDRDTPPSNGAGKYNDFSNRTHLAAATSAKWLAAAPFCMHANVEFSLTHN